MTHEIQEQMANLPALLPDALANKEDIRDILKRFLNALNCGEIRSAEPDGDGGWRANMWIKQGILLCFKVGELVDMS
ncbi:MAG TPA: 2,3,4,5-tetrahydropyridine-2,6-dicarboxylate N-succinyltransferase, partial [Patescibacteria group bacterium]|nr:2,3,4,5-tetrahydropyridine-2,6-dicarboxylate N-succinyltransferase [Patescibacteria group bacterium]